MSFTHRLPSMTERILLKKEISTLLEYKFDPDETEMVRVLEEMKISRTHRKSRKKIGRSLADEEKFRRPLTSEFTTLAMMKEKNGRTEEIVTKTKEK